jgi:hypothetical protein
MKPVRPPSFECTPPPHFEDTTGKNDDDDELAGINSSTTAPLAATTSRPESRTVAARSESRNTSSSTRCKNQKTKNSLNLNKDCTSIVGLIAKLIDLLITNTNKGEDGNVAKRMNILMIRQLDSMDRRMERHDKEDCKEQQHKKKKRQKKKR